MQAGHNFSNLVRVKYLILFLCCKLRNGRLGVTTANISGSFTSLVTAIHYFDCFYFVCRIDLLIVGLPIFCHERY